MWVFTSKSRTYFQKRIKIILKNFCGINFSPTFALQLKTTNDSVAQLVEQYTFNVWVLGSSPSGITR
jgi:hypothetical protein